MKNSIFLIFVFWLFANDLIAQNNQFDNFFTMNPGTIEMHDSEIQEYDVTLKWHNLDALSGSKINCNAVKATYITGLEHDYVKWSNVSIAQIHDFNQVSFSGTPLPAFDDFTYIAMDTTFLSEKLYEIIPENQRDLAKWLVSDAVQMHGLALYIFDSLEFNKAFFPKLLENYNVKFENWVTFTSRYQKLIWSGISKHNGEICAIVKFESFYNPVEINTQQMIVNGRSLYYGEMWISLSDKQVEFASMVEDVVMKMTGAMFPEEQLINLQREIVFTKLK
jgi:hypothetical protein